MIDDERRLGRQKTKRTMMSALLAVLVLLGGVALFATRNTDDGFAPAQSQSMDADLPNLAPEPLQSPPPMPIPEPTDRAPKSETP